MTTETITIKTMKGETSAFVANPDSDTSKAVLVIQEYWGLNDHIKDIAKRYASEGFFAIAPDLYQGEVAKTSSEAGELMKALPVEEGIDTIRKTMEAVTAAYGIGHYGITGFCMGGTYALRAACDLEGISASAPFYGDTPPEDILKKLTAPTIFISATQDAWINQAKVAALEEIAEKYELPITSAKYDADHAFFNDTRPKVYNETAAKDAWALVIGFFNDKL
ncbi:MAG: dienelactone hydrolase family protein [Acidobacteriota bacterium]